MLLRILLFGILAIIPVLAYSQNTNDFDVVVTLSLDGNEVPNSSTTTKYFYVTDVTGKASIAFANSSGAIVQARPYIRIYKYEEFEEEVWIEVDGVFRKHVITGTRAVLRYEVLGSPVLRPSNGEFYSFTQVGSAFSLEEAFSLDEGTYVATSGVRVSSVDSQGGSVGDPEFVKGAEIPFIMIPNPIPNGDHGNDID